MSEDDSKDLGPPLKVLKSLKKYNDSLVETLEGLDEEGLKKKIISAENNVLDTTRALDADEELSALQEQIKLGKASYKDVIKGEQAVAQYCVYLMKSRGYSI